MAMCHVVLVIAVSLLGVARGKQLIFENRMWETVWVGSQGNDNKPPINNGGWEMRPGARVTVNIDDFWAGRFWGRTGCDGNGNCQTGNCGGIQCQGRGGSPPATLAEFTFGGWQGQDFYDISLVDGFNIKVSIYPSAPSAGGYRCAAARCQRDINAACPNELQQRVGGRVVGCKSACLAFNTDQYCCRGAHDRPETCRSSDWGTNYPQIVFKNPCPEAYSYAYDDHKSTFTCEKTAYTIVFG